MERLTKDLPTWVLLFIAPTRVLFESRFMRRRIDINRWSWCFLAINLTFLFLLPLLFRAVRSWALFFAFWGLPLSRIVEIGYAFYNDSFDQMQGCAPRSGLTRIQRFKLLGRSYCETAVCYAALYLAMPSGAFTNHPTDGFDALYFSWITITTTGFGDITPVSALAKGLCMTEVAIGLMLIVFAVGTYFSMSQPES